MKLTKKADKRFKYSTYPAWGTATHDVFHNKIIDVLGYKSISIHHLDLYVKTTLVERMIFLKKALYFFWKIIFLKHRTNDINYRNVSFLHSSIEYTVNNSRKGAFRPVRFAYLRLLYKIVKFIAQVEYLVISDLLKFHVGGDEAYYHDSCIAQVLDKYSLKCIFLKGNPSGIFGFRFNVSTLSAYNFFKEATSDIEISNDELLTTKNLIMNGAYHYARKREYILNKEKLKLLEGSFILYLHDFKDSPGIYGEALFFDQWEWINICIVWARKTNQKMLIKKHPNMNISNVQAIKHLERKISKFKNINLVDFDFNLFSVSKNIRGILTIFGTVMLESWICKIPCIVAAKNHPYMSLPCFKGVNNKQDFVDKLELFFLGKLKTDFETVSENQIYRTYFLVWNKLFQKNLIVSDFPYDDISLDLFVKLFPEVSNFESFGVNERRNYFLVSKVMKRFIEKKTIENETIIANGIKHFLKNY